MELDPLRALLVEYEAMVQRTLRFNRHAVHPDDLLTDIWLVWQELSVAREPTPDLSQPEDRWRLINAWRARTEGAGRLERARRGGALSLDHPAGADSDAPALVDRLAAEAASDPLVGLTALEDALDDALAGLMARTRIMHTWSQPAGYLLLLDERDGSAVALSRCCGLAQASLFMRLQRLMDIHRVQSRLFDGRRRLQREEVRVPPPPAKPREPVAGPSPQPGLWPRTCAVPRDPPAAHGHHPGVEPGSAA